MTNVATSTALPTAQPIVENFIAVEESISVSEMTTEQLVRLKSRQNGINEELAVEMAFCESTIRQFDENGNILRGLVNSYDVGVFQINEKYHLEKSIELGKDIYTAEGNIDYAMWLMKHEGVRHWKASKPCWGGSAHLALK